MRMTGDSGRIDYKEWITGMQGARIASLTWNLQANFHLCSPICDSHV